MIRFFFSFKYCSLVASLCIATLQAFGQSANPQGFFLNDFQLKKAPIPLHENVQPVVTNAATTHITIHPNEKLAKVSKYLYGNNTNPYMGNMVDAPDLMRYVKQLAPNILRYPGGNLCNVFFWNAAPGQQPTDVPDSLIYYNKKNVTKQHYWYGQNESSHTLSVNNYYKMLAQTNSTGLISVNYSYARYGTGNQPVAQAAHLAADWVRFDKGRTKFWEIGNENQGAWQAGFFIDTTKNKDGQPSVISGYLYGQHCKVFIDSMRAAAKEVGAEIYIGTVLIEAPKTKPWESATEKQWNEGYFKGSGNIADYFVVHSYYTPYSQNTPADKILASAKHETEGIIHFMNEIKESFQVALKPLALTEWNIFAVKSKQQVSNISGVHAALVLGELATNQFGMACRWDLANAYQNGDDQGLFSKGDEGNNVPKWNPRPAFYHMYYFQQFFGDHVVKSTVTGSDSVVVYASTFGSGQVGLVVVNKSTQLQNVQIELKNQPNSGTYYWYNLVGGTDNGHFSDKVYVNNRAPKYDAGGPLPVENIPAFAAKWKNNISVGLAPYAVQYLLIDKK